ncbi:hypothetical protein K8I85_17450, partial [bacterium]|nr:hypothetical protein [bacterium]
MRIDQIDIDIAGWPALSGTFRFAARGLASWAAPSESGKSTLVPLVAAALYGIPDDHDHLPPTGWLMLSVTMDDGERLVVARDLGTGMAQVTDSAGIDITDRWSDASSLGEALLGFTHEQFLDVANLDAPALSRTIGDGLLRSMLGCGRGAIASAAAGTPAGHAEPGTARGTKPAPEPPAAPPALDDDLPIFHNAVEEMEWVAASNFAGDRVLSLDGDEDEGAPVAAPEVTASAAAAAPSGQENDGFRALVRRFETAREAMRAKDTEYRSFREQLEELRTEQERLHALEGAEPGDVDRLERLVGELRKTGQRIDRIRVEEQQFREELERGEIAPDVLRPLDDAFRSLTDEERGFLEDYRQRETILRGNQALTRSESRLDESRLQEIQRARDDASRMALAPLAIAALGLFGSIALPYLPQLPIPGSALLAAGLLGAVAGAVLLSRAKRLRHGERNEIAETLDRKREQLSQFDGEAEDAAKRLEELALSRSIPDGASLLRDYTRWQEHLGELGELADFEKRARELEREQIALREKLASFRVAGDDDGTEISDAQLDAMVNDYLRHFTIRDEITLADERASEFEDALAECEGQVAEVKSEIVATLEEAGIEAGDDIDEAIRAYERRRTTIEPQVEAEVAAADALSWGE